MEKFRDKESTLVYKKQLYICTNKLLHSAAKFYNISWSHKELFNEKIVLEWVIWMKFSSQETNLQKFKCRGVANWRGGGGVNVEASVWSMWYLVWKKEVYSGKNDHLLLL